MDTMFLMLTLISFIGSVAMTPIEDIDEEFALAYLLKNKYAGADAVDPRLSSLTDAASQLRMGLMTFQAKYAAGYDLEVTGTLDDRTKWLMSLPRCGREDMLMEEDMPGLDFGDDDGQNGKKRRKRYDTVGSGWTRTDLTYRIMVYTGDLTNSAVDSEVARALRLWSDVTPLTFTRVTQGAADILIYFVRGNAHYQIDQSFFDGRGGELAHAYFPLSGHHLDGDAHFDEDEEWTVGTSRGTNLFQVAGHEFGHSLGLAHSEVRSALMAPFYEGYNPNAALDPDDIAGIQSLYGENQGDMGGNDSGEDDGMGGPDVDASTTAEPMTFPPGAPNFCSDVRIDAMTAHIEGGSLGIYVFRDNYYAKIDTSTGIEQGYPRRISDDWGNRVANGIDAALYLPAYSGLPAYTLLFRGNRFYVYRDNMQYVNDYPLTVLNLPADLSSVDAAFVWRRNGRIYIMSGNIYFRLRRRVSNSQLLRMDSGYPRPLSIWNLPVNSIDGAHQWSRYGLTYFFKDNMYYRYNDRLIQVDQANPPYPREIGTWWFGCSGSYVAYSDQDEGETSGVATVSASLATALITFLVILRML